MDYSNMTTYEQYKMVVTLGGLKKVQRVGGKRARIRTVSGDSFFVSLAGLWVIMNHSDSRKDVPALNERQRKLCIAAWMV